MAFKTFKPRREEITFEEHCRRIDLRRAEVGDVEVPRNFGNRRTESKRALLKAIEEIGGKW